MFDGQPTETKSIFASKTFWFNALSLAVVVAGEMMGSGMLPENFTEYMAMFVTAANVVLRFMTSQPVSMSGK